MKNNEESPKKKSDSNAADIMKKLHDLGYVGVISNVKEEELFVISDESDKEMQLIIDLMVQIIRRRSDDKVNFLGVPLENIWDGFEQFDKDNPPYKLMKEDKLKDKDALKSTEPKKIWIKADHSHSIEDILRLMREWGYKVSEPAALTNGEFGIELQGVYPFNTRESDELKSLDGQEDLMSVASAEQFLKEYGQIKVSLNDIPSTTVNDLPYFKESDLCKYIKGILTVVIKDLDA